MTGGFCQPDSRNAPRRAMTLIELIFVLALLALVVSLVMPSLSPFFRGRALVEEARRVLALTRFAQSEAVSRAVAMELWIDAESGTYGLRPQAGFEFDEGKKPIEFNLAEGLRFQMNTESPNAAGSAIMLFLPSGGMDASSVQQLLIQDYDRREAIEIAQVDGGLGYVIREVTSDE